MKRYLTTACAAIVLAGICSVALAGEQFPFPPRDVAMVDDAEDDEGTAALVEWLPPRETTSDGHTLAGYEVHVFREQADSSWPEGFELLEKRTVALLPDPGANSTPVGGLVPWRSYRAKVTAVYLPEGQAPEVSEEDPLELANADVRRSEPAMSDATMSPVGKWYDPRHNTVLVLVLVYSTIVLLTIYFAQRRDMYIRPIAGLEAVNEAIGRATEMGQPILYITGLSGVSDIATIAAMLILGHLAKRTAAYETPIIVPCNDPIVMAVEREIVRDAYIEAGKPQNYNPENIFYITDSQFGYVAAVDGIMVREKPAANFYMGYFYAESLILAETGSASGAIQIAGTDADTQLPFFITACDYTLMGEELYAASAYLSRSPLLLAQLKGQDIGKVVIIALLLAGAATATAAALIPDAPLAQVLERLISWFTLGG